MGAWAFPGGCAGEVGNLPDKPRLVQTILDQGWIASTEIWKLQSLGVTLGDAFAQKLGLDWMILIDEYGRAPTLKDKVFDLNINPLTMISRRIEEAALVDVQELFLLGCSRVEDLRRAWAGLRVTH